MPTLTISAHRTARPRLHHGAAADLVLHGAESREIRVFLSAEQRADLVDNLIAGSGTCDVIAVQRRERADG